MHLTRFTDHSLRVLYYLSLRPTQRVSIGEIGRAFGVSRNHLVKVVQKLAREGWVKTVRGRAGGVLLAVPPEEIKVGQVVAKTEPGFRLVECFEPRSNTCPITSACGLKGVLEGALDAFFRELDRHTLADLLVNRDALLALLNGDPTKE